MLTTCCQGRRAGGELLHLGSKHKLSRTRSAGDGTSWVATPRLRGNSLSFKVSKHFPCLYAKHPGGVIHTWQYLLFKKPHWVKCRNQLFLQAHHSVQRDMTAWRINTWAWTLQRRLLRSCLPEGELVQRFSSNDHSPGPVQICLISVVLSTFHLHALQLHPSPCRIQHRGMLHPPQPNFPAPLIMPPVTVSHLHTQLNHRLAMRGRDTESELEQTLMFRLKTHLEDGLIRTSRLSLTLIPRCSS